MPRGMTHGGAATAVDAYGAVDVRGCIESEQLEPQTWPRQIQLAFGAACSVRYLHDRPLSSAS